MLNGWLDAYQDPLFWWFGIGTLLVSVGAFLLFAVPFSLIAWKDPPGLRKYRIQERRANPDKVFWPSLQRLALNSTLSLVLVTASWPIIRHTGVHMGPLPAWYVIVGQVIFFMVLDDFLFYVLHRALHTPWLYKRVHAVHHRVTAPWAVAGAYFHPVEYLLITGSALAGPLLVGAHLVTMWIWIVFRQWEASEGHSGYHFPFHPMHWIPGYDGPRFHDFHHAKFKGNYAGFFSYWDRLLGTLSEGYKAHPLSAPVAEGLSQTPEGTA